VSAAARFRILISHHILRLQHFLHEFLLLVHDLEVASVDQLKLVLHDLFGHAHGLFSRLEDGVLFPQAVHGEDLGVGLLSRRPHVRVQANHRRFLGHR